MIDIFRFFFLLIIVLLLEFTALATVPSSEIELDVKNIGNGNYVIQLTINSNLVIENIVYKKRNITNDWVLELKYNTGLKVHRMGAGGMVQSSITLEEYSNVLCALIDYVSSKQDSSLNRIHLDIRLVEDTWLDVVDLIKQESKNIDGVVKNKDKGLSQKLADTLRLSRQVTKTCSIARKHAMECKKDVVAINPLAFQGEFVGGDWSTVADRPDAGLHPSNWFSIALEN